MPFRYISQRARILRAMRTGIGKTGVIYPAAFLGALGIGTMFLGLVFYAREVLHATRGEIGALMGLFSLAYIVGCMLIRPLTDRFLPRYLMIVSAFWMAAFFLLILAAPSLVFVFPLTALVGAGMSLFWPPMIGWVGTDVEGAALGRRLSRFNLACVSGGLISPFLGGWLSGISPELPLYASFACCLAIGLLITGAALAMPRVRADRDNPAQHRPAGKDPGARPAVRYAAWTGLFTTFFVAGMLNSVFPLWSNKSLFVSKAVVGALLTGRTFATSIVHLLMGGRAFWHNRFWPLLVNQALLVLAVLGLTLVETPWALAMPLGVIGMALGVCFFYSLFHGASGPGRASSRGAIHESLLHAGLCVGAFVSGMIYQAHSMTQVLHVAAGVVAVGLVAQTVFALTAAAPKAQADRDEP